MKKGLKSALGAQDSEIIEMRDVDFAQLSKTLRNLNERIILNWGLGEKRTLVLFYYAGHGIMKNFTNIVCDKAVQKKKIFYPLEKQLRSLGCNRGSYVLGIFDCCRAEFSVEFTPSSRGAGVNIQERTDIEEEEGANRNIILTFGCAPNSSVDAVSTIAEEYIRILCADTDSDGYINFPSRDFFTWSPGDGGETVALFNKWLRVDTRGPAQEEEKTPAQPRDRINVQGNAALTSGTVESQAEQPRIIEPKVEEP